MLSWIAEHWFQLSVLVGFAVVTKTIRLAAKTVANGLADRIWAHSDTLKGNLRSLTHDMERCADELETGLTYRMKENVTEISSQLRSIEVTLAEIKREVCGVKAGIYSLEQRLDA